METILAQTMTDWELIVCDSYSNDGAWEFFQKFKDDPRVRLYQVPREGLYAGWNECLKRVQGQYVYFATSDDTARPQCLERLCAVLEAYPDVSLAMCRYETITESGVVVETRAGNAGSFYGPWQQVAHRRSGLLEFFVHVGLYMPSWGSMTTVLFRRDLMAKTGTFRTDCGWWGDWFWAIRSSLFTDTIYLPEVLATWRAHSQQATQRLVTIQSNRKKYEMLKDAVAASQLLLPRSVTKEGDWLQALLRNCRGEYLMQLGLDRGTVQRDPRCTVRGATYGLFHEPRYLLARLLTGLTWNQEFFGHNEEYLRRLMVRMQVPWPPVKVEIS